MKNIKVLKSGEETYYKVCWNTQIELNGKKFVMFFEEDSKGGENKIHHYDEDAVDFRGERVADDEYYEIEEVLFETFGHTFSEFVVGNSYEFDEVKGSWVNKSKS